MRIIRQMDRRLVHLIVLCTFPCLFVSTRAAQKPLTPALFIFGDSIVDGGNNNNLKTRAVANYPPNGIDFPGQAATGRFTNGYTIADLFDKMLNLPLALPYVSTKHIDRLESTSGYNYASSSAGILPETGSYLGKNLDMSSQVKLFQESTDKYTRAQFRNTAALHDYLAKSVFLIHIGTNDYLGNYLQPDRYNTSLLYKPDEYADFLAKKLGKNLKDLYNLGARKFVVFQISRIGCYPELVEKFKSKDKCAENVNNMVTLFNKKMEYQLGHLTFILRRSYFMTANVYNLTRDILDDPYPYGLTETRRGCCQDERFNCLRRTIPCKNRDSHYFWDRFHPSQAVNKIITNECFNNFKVCYPMNVYRLLQI
ncbi:GDSL esterase/lipase 7-like isoform X4 [Primulina tabacum]|uniref:GDSL esterase/lipase 7-like isoform X4 n=1 Tax=Primulina tabacum TaxID=48773 RepID=UPI003F59646F